MFPSSLLSLLSLLLLISPTVAGKSIQQYIQDGIAAAKECTHKGCFFSGMHPASGEFYYPTTTVFDKNTLTSGEEVGCYRIPSILKNPSTTTLHAFAEGRVGTKNKFECADCSPLGIAHRFSTDGGQTWSTSEWVVDTTPTDPADPTSNVGGNIVAFYDDATDRIIVHFVRGVNSNNDCVPGNSNWEVYSLDDGLSWSTPRDISTFLGDFVGVLPGPGVGIQLKKGPNAGRLVVPGHYGTAYRDYGADIVYWSDDSGATWTVTKTPLALMDEDTVVEIGDSGAIMLNMRNADLDLRQRAYAISEDGGATFGPIVFDPKLIDPICEGALAPVDSGVIMFSNPAMQYSRSMLTVRFSDDGGESWDDDKNVVIADKMADYSSLVAGQVQEGTGEGGVLWGSCERPMPWRVWCANAHDWNVMFTTFPLPDAGN